MDYSLAFNYALNAYSLLLNALNTVETPSKYLKSMEGLDIRIKEINILNSTISSLRSDIDMLRM